MEDPVAFLAKDTYAKSAGVELLDASIGRARVRMQIQACHLNSHKTVHGGAIFTLADTAFAIASNTHGIPAAAINATISYMKAARTGTLYAEAEEFACNPKLATYEVKVTDDAGDSIALFQGMVYRKSPSRT